MNVVSYLLLSTEEQLQCTSTAWFPRWTIRLTHTTHGHTVRPANPQRTKHSWLCNFSLCRNQANRIYPQYKIIDVWPRPIRLWRKQVCSNQIQEGSLKWPRSCGLCHMINHDPWVCFSVFCNWHLGKGDVVPITAVHVYLKSLVFVIVLFICI